MAFISFIRNTGSIWWQNLLADHSQGYNLPEVLTWTATCMTYYSITRNDTNIVHVILNLNINKIVVFIFIFLFLSFF